MTVTKENSPVRLRGLQIERVARIRAANLTFDETAGIVEVSGRNEQGKSTLIELIWVALGGQKLDDPIQHGADRGEVELRLEVERSDGPVELRVRRTYTRGDTGVRERLEVHGPQGKLSSPQAVLDGLLSKIALDPYAWLDLARSGLPGRRLMATQLLEGLGIGTPKSVIDIAGRHSVIVPSGSTAVDAISKIDTALRSVRTDIGRQLATAKVQAKMPVGPRVEVPDTRAIAEQLQAARAYCKAISEAKDTEERAAALVRDLRARLERAEQTLVQATAETGAARAAAEKLCGGDPSLYISEREEALGSATELAQKASAWKSYDQALKEGERLQARWDELSVDVDALGRARIDLLAGASLPQGLAMGEDGSLSLDGSPFPGQSSGAQQILTALAVCAATNPRLRLLRVRDGNRLDSEHMETLRSWLVEHDYLALVEIVDESGEVGIVIEDGEVVADNRGD